MERFMTFAAAKDLTEIIEHGELEAVPAHIRRRRGPGSLFGWVGQHLHLPHRHTLSSR